MKSANQFFEAIDDEMKGLELGEYAELMGEIAFLAQCAADAAKEDLESAP